MERACSILDLYREHPHPEISVYDDHEDSDSSDREVEEHVEEVEEHVEEVEAPHLVLARERRAHWKQVCSPLPRNHFSQSFSAAQLRYPDALSRAASNRKLLPTSLARSGIAGIRDRVSTAIVSFSSSFTFRTRRAADAPSSSGTDGQSSPDALRPVTQAGSWESRSGPAFPLARSSQLAYIARSSGPFDHSVAKELRTFV
ncbi:hypothetical protein T484DRAFT_1843071 [Baffinella frigidus]|nr:hypothetical protein T484DRAFT_1843071 [Cryptophyta sp. CCMP2293]